MIDLSVKLVQPHFRVVTKLNKLCYSNVTQKFRRLFFSSSNRLESTASTVLQLKSQIKLLRISLIISYAL